MCECKQEIIEDPKYTKRMYRAVSIGLIVTGILTITTFNVLLPVFSIMLGLFLDFLGVSIMLFLDEFILPGYTIGRISQNAIASSIILFGFIALFGLGIYVGNSYVSNGLGSENESAGTVNYTVPSTAVSDTLRVGNTNNGSSQIDGKTEQTDDESNGTDSEN